MKTKSKNPMNAIRSTASVRAPSSAPARALALALTLATIPAVALSSCSRERAQLPARKHVPELGQGSAQSSGGPDAGTIEKEIPPLKSALAVSTDPASAPMACDRIEELKHSQSTGGYRFSFLEQLWIDSSKHVPMGRISLADSPLARMILAEKFKFPTGDEFYAAAKKKFETGELDLIKWTALNASVLLPHIFNDLHVNGVNDGLQEKFPGIFGQAGPMHKSLHGSLMMKARALDGGPSDALVAKLPLFDSAGWSGVAADIRASLAAAVASRARQGDSDLDRRERACGFVLWHRAFAQLLAFKGHLSPSLQSGAAPKMTKDRKEFPKQQSPGAFFDPSRGEPVALTPQDIATYNPASRPFSVGATPPSGLEITRSGGLSAQLELLESTVYLLDATHPGSAWFPDRAAYPLGDIQDPAGKGFVPSDAHALALGLTTMSFKNLGAFHIKKITAQGTLVQGSEPPAGVVLVDEGDLERRETTVRISDASRFARAALYLERVLDQLQADVKLGTSWYLTEASLPYATPETRAKLLGESGAASKEAFESLLSPEERKTILKDSLVQLHAPLALLIGQLVNHPDGCVAEVSLDLGNGARKPLRRCTDAEAREAREAMRMIGHQAKAPILLR